MSISLTSDSRGLVVKTPYSSTFVTELKRLVSDPKERAFTGKPENAWVVDPKHAPTIQRLILATFGQAIALPEIKATNNRLENHEIRVEYVGQCKERADGQVTATGFDGQGWNVVFPESVLKAFFEGGELNITVDGMPEAKAKTLYQALLIPPTATASEIKSAYKRMARLVHPDVNKEPDAQEQFLVVQHAYEVLSDALKRKRYNAGLAFTASLTAQKDEDDFYSRLRAGYNSGPYRAPLRCGLVTINGKQVVGRVIVEKILAWNDIINQHGQTMVTSWNAAAETFDTRWV